MIIDFGAHMGGYKMYDEVLNTICSVDVYLETSFAHHILGKESFANLISKHGADKVLFGTDSTWDDAKSKVNMIDGLKLSSSQKDMRLYKNAHKLLSI